MNPGESHRRRLTRAELTGLLTVYRHGRPVGFAYRVAAHGRSAWIAMSTVFGYPTHVEATGGTYPTAAAAERPVYTLAAELCDAERPAAWAQELVP